jgi:midasin
MKVLRKITGEPYFHNISVCLTDSILRSLENIEPAEVKAAEANGSGSTAIGLQQGQAPVQNEIQTTINPLRSLGDALKEIRHRFDDILSPQQPDAPVENIEESASQSQIQYLQPEDVGHDMQALGPAGEEQTAKLDQLTLIDDENTSNDGRAMDVDMPLPAEDPQRNNWASEQRNDVEAAIMRDTLGQHSETPKDLPETAGQTSEEDEGNDDHAVEMQLRSWRVADYPDEGAERIWRSYESLTHDLAYALCEQLRLILEPTLATRLKGDYRTGKRLNMKKVISYIASDYTKDKIWLRRTKPSQREYQVLISIDDSRSMAESHSIHLAYQTLALISKALSRLESGDIAIAKFGETVDLLHGFNEGPFTDQAGTKVMNAFRFQQKATNVLSMLETSLTVLESARERQATNSSSAADLWQLQIIISDGMCQDHDKLRTILRKANEQRVMVVFIILDSLHAAVEPGVGQQGSIISMDKAEFKNVDGKMELQLQKYLDSFPFEYYVVLRNVEALPEVLAGTLKQFLERITDE